MKRKNWILFICMVLLLTSLHNPILVGATDGTQNVDGLFTQAEVSGYRDKGTYPTKSGYVFAGWYQDATRETPVTGDTPTNGAYAKFVNEKVLTILFQLKNGTTMQSETTDLRLITSVDSRLYQQVGFKLQVGDNLSESEITSNTVYSTISTYSDEKQQKYKPSDVFDKTDSKYFMTKVLAGIKSSSFEKEIRFTPFWTTMDGTKVTGTARTIQILEFVSGFVAGDGTTLTKVTKDGKQVVKAELSGSGKRVYFQDVITANGEKGKFFSNGYQYVTFDMYIESASAFNFNTSTHGIWTNGAGYDWSNNAAGSGKQGDYLSTYLNGVKTPINKGAWYTVCMKVENYSTDVSIAANGGTATIYLKNLTFLSEPLGFVAGDGTTITRVTKDEEEVVKAELSSSGKRVYFKNVITASGDKGKFFDLGYKYVTFEMYIESASAFNFNTSTHGIWTNGAGYDWSNNAAGSGKQGDYLRTYLNGVRTPINKGAWYTVSMKVENYSTDVSIAANGGAATIYLKNLTFTNDFPEEVKFMAEPLGFVAGDGTTITKVTKDEEEVVKAELSASGKRVYFQDVITASGEKGKFFSEGYQYVTFDMYIESVAGAFNFNTSTHGIWTNGAGYDWSNNSAGSGKQGDFLRTYLNGVRTPINKGAWYTVCMKVENYSTDVSIAANGGAATIYLKNLTFTNAFPE